MALPAIAAVRRTWSAARVTVAARASVAPLFSLVDGVDETIALRGDRMAGAAAAAQLKPGSFDAAILLPNSFQIALAVWRAGIPERWGYRADGRGLLLTRGVSRPPPLHQAEYYYHLVRELGCTSAPTPPQLRVPRELRERGEDALRAAGWNGEAPIVALAPGAAYGGAKRWPAASFAALAKELAGRDGIAVCLVGAAADAEAGAEVVSDAGVPLMNLIGRTDIPLLAGVLSVCRGLVTNDSGAMHVAAALGIAVTAMFGPTREEETRPLSAPGKAEPVLLVHDVWCRPCMLRECPLVHRCMRGIRVDAVLAAARRSL
jgi:heptosyltransferase-2